MFALRYQPFIVGPFWLSTVDGLLPIFMFITFYPPLARSSVYFRSFDSDALGEMVFVLRTLLEIGKILLEKIGKIVSKEDDCKMKEKAW